MEMILVGDPSMCIYGYDGTVPVTMDQCIYHCEAVRRAAANTFVIGDMPFLSYQVSVEEAVRNAGRFYKEARVDAIKLEGWAAYVRPDPCDCGRGDAGDGAYRSYPQSSGQLGGFKGAGTHGRDGDGADRRRPCDPEGGGLFAPRRGGAAGGLPDHPRRSEDPSSTASGRESTPTAS